MSTPIWSLLWIFGCLPYAGSGVYTFAYGYRIEAVVRTYWRKEAFSSSLGKLPWGTFSISCATLMPPMPLHCLCWQLPRAFTHNRKTSMSFSESGSQNHREHTDKAICGDIWSVYTGLWIPVSRGGSDCIDGTWRWVAAWVQHTFTLTFVVAPLCSLWLCVFCVGNLLGPLPITEKSAVNHF